MIDTTDDFIDETLWKDDDDLDVEDLLGINDKGMLTQGGVGAMDATKDMTDKLDTLNKALQDIIGRLAVDDTQEKELSRVNETLEAEREKDQPNLDYIKTLRRRKAILLEEIKDKD